MERAEYSGEKIHGFCSLQKYTRFVQYFEIQVKAGHIIEIEPDPEYGYEEVYVGRWFGHWLRRSLAVD
jgi:hypothetical protein